MMTSSGRGCTTSPGSTRSRPQARARIFCIAVCPPDGRLAEADVIMLRLLFSQYLQGVHRDGSCMLVVENDGSTRRFRAAIPDSDEERTHLFDALRRTAGNHQR